MNELVSCAKLKTLRRPIDIEHLAFAIGGVVFFELGKLYEQTWKLYIIQKRWKKNEQRMRRCKYDFKWELFPIHIIIYLWIYADMVGGRMQKESILLGKLLAIRSDSVKVGVGNHVLLIEKQICLVSDSVNLCLLKRRGFDCWIKYKSIHII